MGFVLNRANTATDVALSDVASVVGTRRIFQLPTAGALPTQAINHGRGFLESSHARHWPKHSRGWSSASAWSPLTLRRTSLELAAQSGLRPP